MPITVETHSRTAVVNVTDRVANAIPADIDSGTCTVFVPHTTAGITVNEDESGLVEDIMSTLKALVPASESYAHDRIDDNADSHLRASLLGSHVTVPVRDGELALGTWQSLLFVDCDGPRSRCLSVTVLPGVAGDGT